MEIEIRANGRLQFIISDPVGPVQEAALVAMNEAVSKGQQVTVEPTEANVAGIFGLSISVAP